MLRAADRLNSIVVHTGEYKMMTRRMMMAATLALTVYVAPAIAEDKPKATLYRNPNCSCCLDYAKYLRENGFDVTVDSKQDLAAVRKQLHIAEKFEGCHVMTVGRYAVEGHVSADNVNNLLKEQPDIIGISIPGMPSGTPGMTGTKTGPLSVYEIRSDSAPSKVFGTE
jgi:hypothetical protein